MPAIYLFIEVVVLFVVYMIGILGIRWLFRKRNPTPHSEIDWLIAGLLLGWTIVFIKTAAYLVRLTLTGP